MTQEQTIPQPVKSYRHLLKTIHKLAEKHAGDLITAKISANAVSPQHSFIELTAGHIAIPARTTKYILTPKDPCKTAQLDGLLEVYGYKEGDGETILHEKIQRALEAEKRSGTKRLTWELFTFALGFLGGLLMQWIIRTCF